MWVLQIMIRVKTRPSLAKETLMNLLGYLARLLLILIDWINLKAKMRSTLLIFVDLINNDLIVFEDCTAGLQQYFYLVWIKSWMPMQFDIIRFLSDSVVDLSLNKAFWGGEEVLCLSSSVFLPNGLPVEQKRRFKTILKPWSKSLRIYSNVSPLT